MTRGNPAGWPFDAHELGDADAAELRSALEAGRALERSIDDVPTRVPADFGARVMAAVANEPAPGTVGFMAPLRRRGIVAGFGASVRQAWGTISAPGLPSFARATALAYVLVVAVAGVALAGAATISVGSALGVLGPAPTSTAAPRSTELLPPATLAPPTGPSATDDHGNEASESPEASDDRGGVDETNEPGDDGDGGNAGPGSSHGGSDGGGSDGGGDGGHSGSGGSGSGSGGHTPRPGETPRASETPEPSEGD